VASPRSASRQVPAEDSGGFISGHPDNGGATGGPTFSGHIVDIEVDPDTGKVTILRYTCVEDVGQALHPSYVEGQIQGGAAQGIGMALTEEYFYDAQGVLRNASLLDYRMPTTLDVPMIDTILIEVPNPGHPYGVRGVGEPPIVPPMGAIANAIYAATSVRALDAGYAAPSARRVDGPLRQGGQDRCAGAVAASERLQDRVASCGSAQGQPRLSPASPGLASGGLGVECPFPDGAEGLGRTTASSFRRRRSSRRPAAQ
jgi:hypothetical protein